MKRPSLRNALLCTILVAELVGAAAGLAVHPGLADEAGPPGRTPLTRWGPRGGGRHPAVVLVHGGGGPAFFTDRDDFRPYPEALAAAGFVVVMPHHARSRVRPELAVRRALEALSADPHVDPDRIGLVGFSSGGFLGSCVAGTDDRVRAFVGVYGGLDASCLPRMRRMPATLVLHGARDGMVPLSAGRQIAALAKRRGAVAETHVYPDQEHGFVGAALDDSVRRMVRFFRDQLRGQRRI